MANLLNYIVWDPDPILFHLGPIALRYYATCWLVGLLLGYLLMQRLYRQQKIGDEKFISLSVYWRVHVWDIAFSISQSIFSVSGIMLLRC